MMAKSFLCALLGIWQLIVARADNGKRVTVTEVVFDSAVSDMRWLGADRKTVLTQTAKGRLYRSADEGKSWNDITDKLREVSESQLPITVSQIMVSKADMNMVVVAGTKHDHFASQDAGATWTTLKQKSTIHTFRFHATRPHWALLSSWTEGCNKWSKKAAASSPCNHMLYLTKDLGKTFELVTSYVVQFSWGDVSQNQQDRIYFTHFESQSGDQPKLSLWSQKVTFSYSDNGGKSMRKLVAQGNKFLISHSFIFVAKLKDFSKQTVVMMISPNGGKTFNAAKLPQELEEKSYTLLDTSEGTVMLHVNHGNFLGTPVGNVYVSGSEGFRFTLSLPNNVRSGEGQCEFDKILSLEGVYMANFRDTENSMVPGELQAHGGKSADASAEAEALEDSATETAVDQRRGSRAKGKDESVVRTVISFDKGAVWSYLKPPRVDSLGVPIECPPDRCWLHLHGITNSNNYAPFYSIEQAAGIIMGTGNVGPYLRFETDQVNTFMSRDGGLTWAEVHKGAFIYEFGDHGGLTLMANDIMKTSQVVFSWDEGHSWFDFELSQRSIDVDNIVTEPNATSTKFLLYGTRSDSGVLYYMDFDPLGQPLCQGVWSPDSVASDYETWSPSDGRSGEQCTLGRQITYTRRKQSSACFNGEKFERPTTRKNCACTTEDFVCEVGFTRQVGSTECKFADDELLATPQRCQAVDSFKMDAYRKVVGDSCEGGWQPEKLTVPCPFNSKFTKGARSVLGTVCMVGFALFVVTYMSRTDPLKKFFANSSFEALSNAPYSAIGNQSAESALESIGSRYDADFMEGDDDFGDAPQLMSYTSERRREPETISRVNTATSHVPKLQAPPGTSTASADRGDDVDLL